jgi:hypothetical protein
MLLHRHPLSTAGERFAKVHEAKIALSGRGIRDGNHGDIDGNGNGEYGEASEARTQSHDDDVVPKIDLRAGLPDIELPGFAEWLDAEEERFKDTVVYDSASQIDVVQVAVSWLLTGLYAS